MTLSSVFVDSSGQSGELVSMKYVEVIFAADVDRSTKCGCPRRRRRRELSQLRCPFQLAIPEAHDDGLTPKLIDPLTPLARGLIDAGSHACGGVAVARA